MRCVFRQVRRHTAVVRLVYKGVRKRGIYGGNRYGTKPFADEYD